MDCMWDVTAPDKFDRALTELPCNSEQEMETVQTGSHSGRASNFKRNCERYAMQLLHDNFFSFLVYLH